MAIEELTRPLLSDHDIIKSAASASRVPPPDPSTKLKAVKSTEQGGIGDGDKRGLEHGDGDKGGLEHGDGESVAVPQSLAATMRSSEHPVTDLASGSASASRVPPPDPSTKLKAVKSTEQGGISDGDKRGLEHGDGDKGGLDHGDGESVAVPQSPAATMRSSEHPVTDLASGSASASSVPPPNPSTKSTNQKAIGDDGESVAVVPTISRSSDHNVKAPVTENASGSDSAAASSVPPPNPFAKLKATREESKQGGLAGLDIHTPPSSVSTSAPATSASAPTAPVSATPATPDAHALVLESLGQESLLHDVKRFAASFSDTQSTLAAPAEDLANKLFAFVDTVVNKTSPIGPRWQLGRAALALAEAADNAKAAVEVEAAQEAGRLSRRAMQLILPHAHASASMPEPVPPADASAAPDALARLLASTTPETPNAHAMVLACLEQETLLDDVKRFAASFSDTQSSLAAPAENLAIALFAFLDTIVNKRSIVDSQWKLARAILALANAADSSKAAVEVEAAQEAGRLSRRAMHLIHKEIDQKGDRSYRKSLAEQERTPRGCCFCCWSQPLDDKESLKDKWSTFFSVSLPISLGVLPLILKYIPEKYKALFGGIYGVLILASVAGLLINLNAVDRCDVKAGQIIGNLSVLTLAVLVSFYIWSSLAPGSVLMPILFVVVIALTFGYSWIKCCHGHWNRMSDHIAAKKSDN